MQKACPYAMALSFLADKPKVNQKNRPFGLWFEKITPASGNV